MDVTVELSNVTNEITGEIASVVAPASFDRAVARLSVDLRDARLRESGERGAAVVVEDLSCKGFKTEWPYQMQVGERVWLTLPGLEAKAATVRWTRAYKIGCQFEQEMHAAVFDHLVRRLKLVR